MGDGTGVFPCTGTGPLCLSFPLCAGAVVHPAMIDLDLKAG